jgi:hypothetical protein
MTEFSNPTGAPVDAEEQRTDAGLIPLSVPLPPFGLASLALMKACLLVAAAAATGVVIVAPGFARPQTTNPGTYETVKVTITDSATTVRPNVSARGVTAVFIITNRGKKTHTWVIGDTTRGPGKTIGFSRTLKPEQQRTVVLFLDFRGRLPYYIPDASRKPTMRGAFIIK